MFEVFNKLSNLLQQLCSEHKMSGIIFNSFYLDVMDWLVPAPYTIRRLLEYLCGKRSSHKLGGGGRLIFHIHDESDEMQEN